jgi:hypothetical protein
LSPNRTLSLSTFVSCALAVLWSKASAVYNWGNIGGRVDANFEAWYWASGPIAYSSLFVWLATIGFAIYLTRADRWRRRILWPGACALAPVAVMWASDLWFHRGFPTISG